MRRSTLESGKPGGSRRRGRGWIVLFLLLTGVALALFVIDRRGDRVMAPPPPGPGAVQPSLPELPPSRLSLHVLYDLDEIFAALEDATPVQFGDLTQRRPHPQTPRLTHALTVTRDSLDVRIVGDTVHVSTTLHYQGRIWFDSPFGGELATSCREEGEGRAPRVIARLSFPVDIAPSWAVRTGHTLVELTPASEASRDRCVVSFGPIRMDVTDALLALATQHLEESAGAMGSRLRDLDLSSSLEPHWARIQQPISLGPDIWLRIDADSVIVDRISGQGESGRILSARLALVGRPRIVLGSPPEGPHQPLPSLAVGPVEERFVALADARIEYRQLAVRLQDALEGRAFEVAGRSLRVVDTDVLGAGGGRVAVEVETDGAIRGRLYLIGTPILDPASGEVTVPDLGFSVSSRNVLLESAAWLLRGTFPDLVRRHVRWNVHEATEGLSALSGRTLDRRISETVQMEGTLSSVRILDAVSGEDALLIRSRGDGTLRLRVSSLSPSVPRSRVP